MSKIQIGSKSGSSNATIRYFGVIRVAAARFTFARSGLPICTSYRAMLN
ncbi:MAG: hypothetical protein ABIR38_01580 [Chthoniobacterales bacterium]